MGHGQYFFVAYVALGWRKSTKPFNTFTSSLKTSTTTYRSCGAMCVPARDNFFIKEGGGNEILLKGGGDGAKKIVGV